jgi:hypothetical protein
MDFERDHFAHLDFFAASLERLEQDTLKGFSFHRPGRLKKTLYNLAQRKPSVSFGMMMLAMIFISAWAILLGLSIARFCTTVSAHRGASLLVGVVS